MKEASEGGGVLRPSEGAMGAKVEDEVVIFERQQDKFFGVRGVGVRIWQLIGEESHTADDIARRICDEFDADEATIRRDVAEMIGNLSAHGLIATR